MDIWDEIKKLTGYQSGNGGIKARGWQEKINWRRISASKG